MPKAKKASAGNPPKPPPSAEERAWRAWVRDCARLLELDGLTSRFRVTHDSDAAEIRFRLDGVVCRRCRAFVAFWATDTHDCMGRDAWDGGELQDRDVYPAALFSAPFRNRIPRPPTEHAGYELSDPYVVDEYGAEVPVSGHTTGQTAHGRAMKYFHESFHAGQGFWDHDEEASYGDRRWRARRRHEGTRWTGDRALRVAEKRQLWIETGGRRVPPKPRAE